MDFLNLSQEDQTKLAHFLKSCEERSKEKPEANDSS
jgi:hypothetical protein